MVLGPQHTKTLNHLHELSKELTLLSDGLNVKIHGIEAEIWATAAKVRAEIPLSEGVRLCWAKLGDTWGLGIHWVDDKQTEALVKVARDLRLQAIDRIPELLSELVRRTQEMIDQVKKAGAA